jgi:hypothetical protein
MPTNFPTSVDSLANPTATTRRNDPGFELHAVVSTLNDAVEALETKLGTGASTAAAGQVLRATGAGASAFGAIQSGDLAANAITQVGSSYSTSPYALTFSASYSFITDTVVHITTTGGDLLVWVSMAWYVATAATVKSIAVQLDSATDVPLAIVNQGVANQVEFVGGVYRFTGVSSALHDVYIKVKASAGTLTLGERSLLVMERKR